MARFYIAHPKIEGGLLRVDGNEARHIHKVLRLKVGDPLSLFDAPGKGYEGSIVGLTPTSVVIQIHKVCRSTGESSLDITLAQSLLKGEKMDYLIQKATELGIWSIQPFLSSRSIPIVDKSQGMNRNRRWERIAIEASKQCGRGIVPKIHPILDFSSMLQWVPKESFRLILWEKEGRKLKEVLRARSGRDRIVFVVGPEGGFSQGEVKMAAEEEFLPIQLGERVLRSETASLCLLSILQYELGDMG